MKSLLFMSLWMVALCQGAAEKPRELLQNRAWENPVNGMPTGWRFQTYQEKSVIALAHDPLRQKNVAVIHSPQLDGRGYVGQFAQVHIPAGAPLTLSGWYRTDGITFGAQGKVRAGVTYNHELRDPALPAGHQALELPLSTEWKFFSITKKLTAPSENFLAVFQLDQASGKLFFDDLSLTVQEQEGRLNPREKYIWREGEDVQKYGTVLTWSNGNEGYYSGRGGLYLKQEPCTWLFHLRDEVNPDNLLPEQRNYHLWLRMYGYRDQPNLTIQFNQQTIGNVRTRPNELLRDGEYAGPGEYYWQYAGSFVAAGGKASLRLIPERQLLLDALLVTTDALYMPEKFEAKPLADPDFFTDTRHPYAMVSDYKIYGISSQVHTPLLFSYQGAIQKIPGDQPPAIFHVELPENIELTHVSSHWAGQTWNVADRWGERFLTWKKTGSGRRDDITYQHYEISLYYLANTCTLFVKGGAGALHPGQAAAGYYALEYQNERQLTEKLPLVWVDLEPAPAFKTILIGPAGGNGRDLYQEFPGLAEDMRFRGMNIINAWHLQPAAQPQMWKKFRDDCHAANIVIAQAHSPFYGIFEIQEKQYQALSLSGTSSRHRPALAIDENSPSLQKTLEHLKSQGRQGITGIVLDDENFNRQKDNFDYNPLTLKKFEDYLQQRGHTYVDPRTFVQNQNQHPELYRLWVEFKCEAMVALYRRYQQAFLEGVRAAPSSSTLGKSLFIPQILVDRTPEESKINTFWDYRKLAEVCDFISPMIYTYDGIRSSARVGDHIEMYNAYIGRQAIVPTLLCEHGGFGQVEPDQKAMFTYQIYEALMQQSRIVLFWHGHSVFNPINSQYISQAIRCAAPYEDIILNGSAYTGLQAPEWLRVKALKLDRRILLYAANYRNPQAQEAKISVAGVRKVLDVSSNREIPITADTFVADFTNTHGKLFLLTH